MIDKFCNKYKITKSEQRILYQIIVFQCLSSDQISKRLQSKFQTVKLHKNSILKKLDVKTELEVEAKYEEFTKHIEDDSRPFPHYP